MARSFIISLKKPHERFQLPTPVGRRVLQLSRSFWIVCLFVVSVGCLGFSIFSVNQSAAKTYALRSLERQEERLTETVGALEGEAAQQQSFQQLQQRVQGLGYTPIQRVIYIDGM